MQDVDQRASHEDYDSILNRSVDGSTTTLEDSSKELDLRRSYGGDTDDDLMMKQRSDYRMSIIAEFKDTLGFNLASAKTPSTSQESVAQRQDSGHPVVVVQDPKETEIIMLKDRVSELEKELEAERKRHEETRKAAEKKQQELEAKVKALESRPQGDASRSAKPPTVTPKAHVHPISTKTESSISLDTQLGKKPEVPSTAPSTGEKPTYAAAAASASSASETRDQITPLRSSPSFSGSNTGLQRSVRTDKFSRVSLTLLTSRPCYLDISWNPCPERSRL